MRDHSVHKASDLAQDERSDGERWLGRAVFSDETISVNACLCHAAPTGAEREALRRDIVAQALEIGSRGQDTPEDDVDALLQEALADIRGKRG
jgi:hypothetical protein